MRAADAHGMTPAVLAAQSGMYTNLQVCDAMPERVAPHGSCEAGALSGSAGTELIAVGSSSIPGGCCRRCCRPATLRCRHPTWPTPVTPEATCCCTTCCGTATTATRGTAHRWTKASPGSTM